MEEQGSKKDIVRSACPHGLKIVFTLLAEMVTIHMQVLIKEIGELSFKSLFAKIRPMIMF